MAHAEEVELPEEIIQHIQSFMECRTAAQTSLLSKSWHKAWSTRPPLLFYGNNNICNNHWFWAFLEKFVQLYFDLNLVVDKFVFRMPINKGVSSLAGPLISTALRLRINTLHLDFSHRRTYTLPEQAFENSYLTELNLTWCSIEKSTVLCSKLASLRLHHVSVRNDMFRDVLLACPLIEHLNLSGNLGELSKINLSNTYNLKTLIFDSRYGIITVKFEECCIGLASGVRFLKLSRLVLKRVKVESSFFSNLSSIFPCLKDLTLDIRNGYQDIRISSHSLERLSLVKFGKLAKTGNLDVPNISKFNYYCSHNLPVLSFTSISKEWISEVKLSFLNDCGVWFSKLRDLLMKLGGSKISLRVKIKDSDDYFVAPVRDIGSSHVIPIVENLEIIYKGCEFFMGCLLWSCRPRLVTQTYDGDMKVVCILYEKLMDQIDKNAIDNTYQASSIFINDLKEVGVEFFEESLMEWQPVKVLPNFEEILNSEVTERLRFKLAWGSLTPEPTIIRFI